MLALRIGYDAVNKTTTNKIHNEKTSVVCAKVIYFLGGGGEGNKESAKQRKQNTAIVLVLVPVPAIAHPHKHK
jgi:hypothetical protein